MTNPSEMHMKETEIIFKYVKGALNLVIHCYTSKSFELVRFNDFDWCKLHHCRAGLLEAWREEASTENLEHILRWHI